jgi:hypothetical protein
MVLTVDRPMRLEAELVYSSEFTYVAATALTISPVSVLRYSVLYSGPPVRYIICCVQGMCV